jgi:hypothetical protein
MYVKDIYEIVQVNTPCTQPVFLAHLHSTIQYLLSKYGEKYVVLSSRYIRPVTLDTDIAVDDAYFSALVDNISYLVSGNEDRKVDFVEEAENAYRQVWKEKHKNGKFLSRGYCNV